MLLVAAPETLWVLDTNRQEPFRYAKTAEVLSVFSRFYMWNVRKNTLFVKDKAKVLVALPQSLFRSVIEYL